LRGYDKFALVAFAGELAISRGILSWRPGDASKACEEMAATWIEARGGIKELEAEKALSALRNYILEHGDRLFEHLERSKETSSFSPFAGSLWQAPDKLSGYKLKRINS
jgi:putative DNA primase/helicase